MSQYKEPRFFRHDDRLYLVSVTKEEGRITNLAGPYQCVGEANMSPKNFVKQFSQIMLVALHASEPLTLADLPEALQATIKADIEAGLKVTHPKSADEVVV